MRENIIKNKTFDFALDIIRLSDYLNDNKKFVIANQILKSGTSVGALTREAEFAESKKDFIHKFSIAQKEANETIYWLDLLFKSNSIDENTYNDFSEKINEIIRLITSIIKTSKKNIDIISINDKSNINH